MPEKTNTQQKAVTLEALREASALIATKAEVKSEVKKQMDEAGLTGVTFATTEEVLALFQEADPAPSEE